MLFFGFFITVGGFLEIFSSAASKDLRPFGTYNGRLGLFVRLEFNVSFVPRKITAIILV